MQLLFADQLGSHFDLGGDILLPIVKNQFKKRPYHRQKAHLILFALRARSKDPRVQVVEVDSYRDLVGDKRTKTAISPSSHQMLDFANALGIDLLDHRGFCSSRADFAMFAEGKKRLRLEDFYRLQRQRLGLLMNGQEPEGGKWNFDEANRLPPPKQGLGIKEPWMPTETELDQEVRAELDALEAAGVVFVGEDGPRRFAATTKEAELAVSDFLTNRLDLFGPYEDAIDSGDWVMAHSMLSVPMNLGLIDPINLVRAVEAEYLAGRARIESVEGFIRQVVGWRDFVWQLYWHFGKDYTAKNELQANTPLPATIRDLISGDIEANCLSWSIDQVNKAGWTHHIPRLMILGNIFMQRGFSPKEVNDWFIDSFVDGTPWVMPANVIGMSLFADGGQMSTKPYAAGGAYINKMSNLCKGCKFDPKVRLGENACPVTAGYWDFIGNNLERFSKNHRMFQSVSGYKRLSDTDAIHEQERTRGGL